MRTTDSLSSSAKTKAAAENSQRPIGQSHLRELERTKRENLKWNIEVA
jgi:hypothetical protein